MHQIFHKFLDLLIPPRCPVCGTFVREEESLCASCFARLHFITKPYCSVCGRPFEFVASQPCVCSRCLQHPPSFSKARSAVVYDSFSKKLILPFKHMDRLDLTPFLCKLMHFSAAELMPEIDLITPVPLNRWRLLKRKYNQSALLAQHLAKQYQKMYIPDLLKRVRATPTQGRMTAKERRQNVSKAFALNRPIPQQGLRILLVDDVLTTGATANECARVLLKAGATSVCLLSFASTILMPSHDSM